MARHIEIARRIEGILTAEFFLPPTDVRDIHIPSAIIGYLPASLEAGASGKSLRELYNLLATSCTALRVGELAEHFKVEPRAWKELWRLADDDRESAIIQQLELSAERSARISLLRQKLATDFLGADAFYEAECQSLLSREDFEALKVDFVDGWLRANLPRESSFDRDQIQAIASVSRDTLVSARAGSGKTSTVVARAFFLCRHCGVAPTEILILAFNRNAAAEVLARFRGLSGLTDDANRGPPPHAMTFHALAYALVNPAEDMLTNSKDGEDETLNRFVQSIIDDRLKSDSAAAEIQKLMMAHFRNDWERISSGGYLLRSDELVAYRRELPRETLRGEYVKSFGEKVIADTLMEYGIPYRYERNFRWNGKNYRPDFTILRGGEAGGVVIEYFGLAGDPDYDDMSVAKRAFWAQRAEWQFLEYSPRELMRDGIEAFKARLIAEIRDCGVPCRKLSEVEIWERIKDRAVDRFTRAVSSFISRARKSKLSPGEIADRSVGFGFISEAETLFVAQAIGVYTDYLDRLQATGSDDFDGLILRGAKAIGAGQVRFERKETGVCDVSRIRFVFVDEFQDFSPLFFDLLQALRTASGANLFCVGDDWQAINGFAGSDVTYFRSFSDIFPGSNLLSITTNYRSSMQIVQVGNALMDGLGDFANPRPGAPEGRIFVADMSLFRPVTAELNRFQGDEISPAVTRIACDLIRKGGSLTALARKNSLPWYVSAPDAPGARFHSDLAKLTANVRSCISRSEHARFKTTTTHSFKGLQDEATIILDATSRCYPFIHPDWVFSRILGITLEDVVDEERRLLYVALTRAQVDLYIVLDSSAPPRMLARALENVRSHPVDWERLLPATTGSPVTHLLIRLLNIPGARVIRPDGTIDQPLYHARSLLKDAGYRFRRVNQPAWEKTIPVIDFELESVLSEPWVSQSEGIRLNVLDENEVEIISLDLGRNGWVGDRARLQEYLARIPSGPDGDPASANRI